MKSLYQKMANQMASWNTHPNKDIVLPSPVFDKKYNTILEFPSTETDIEKIMWVNDSASNKSVDIKYMNNTVYMAFEDDSDALIFRIKFL